MRNVSLLVFAVAAVALAVTLVIAMFPRRQPGLECAVAVPLMLQRYGSGFDTAAQAYGPGLGSMRDRATSADGDLRISSVPGRGTKVEVRL